MRSRKAAGFAVAALVLALVAGAGPARSAGDPTVVHFTAAGDYGESANTANVLDGIRSQNPDLNVAVGDLSYDAPGTEQKFCDFVTSHVGAGFPFELVSGNHESDGTNGNINDFSACLPNQLPGVVGTYGRQYYVDVPKDNPLVRFVLISPGLTYPDGAWSYAAGSPHYTWTAAAIDGARSAGIPWVVVGMHEVCISMGNYGCSVSADLARLLVSKRVDLVLTGHEHFYQRTKQLAQSSACPSLTIGTYDARCVADSDSDLAQGAGTVFATEGTGGVQLRDVNTSDSEAGYFAAYEGGNVNPAFGYLDVQATADQMSARFVPVGGATFTDSFVIHRGPPPPNQPPIARFTATPQGLTATVDASASADPDGTIASYAWDFGDGTTGSGMTAQHTYATANTYQVTLTVTDDDGATGSVTQPVTVSPSTQPAPFVTDDFNRTVVNGLGTADLGGAWSTSGTASDFSVNSGSGAVRLVAGAERKCWLGATTRTDTDLRMALALDKVPAGGSAYLSVAGRRISANNEFQGSLVLSSSGRINVSLKALRNSATAVTLASTQLPSTVTYGAGTQLAVRLQVTGTNPTTLRLKVWPATSAEPSAWQLTATDSTAGLQNPGAVGLSAYLAGGVTNGPAVVRMDGLSARPTS